MTYAIFRAAGFQYRAEVGDILRLPSLDARSGETVIFDQVLLGSADGEVLVGRPTLKGAAVRAQVMRHGRADKVIVFKFKRRKNYRRKQGHRQGFTEVRVSEIDLGGKRRVTLEPAEKTTAKAAKAPAKKKQAEAKAGSSPKAAAKSVSASAKPAAKKSAAKKPVAKKPVAKKPVAKKPVARTKKGTEAKTKKTSKPKKKS